MTFENIVMFVGLTYGIMFGTLFIGLIVEGGLLSWKNRKKPTVTMEDYYRETTRDVTNTSTEKRSKLRLIK